MRNADSSFARLQSGAAQECVMRNLKYQRNYISHSNINN